MRLLLILAIAGLVSLGISARSGLAAPMKIALPDCVGKPVVEPASVMLACGDGNFSIEHIKWTGWGASFAAGMGTGNLNDCEPNCAAGHFHTYPMLLVVQGRQSCPNGEPAYATVTYAFIGRSPIPQNKPEDATQSFPCKPMR